MAPRVVDAIEAASVVIFLLSPNWAASEVCQREAATAIDLQKKLIPVVVADVTPQQVPPDVAALNWIFARPGDPLDRSIGQLAFTIASRNPTPEEWRQLLGGIDAPVPTGKVCPNLP